MTGLAMPEAQTKNLRPTMVYLSSLFSILSRPSLKQKAKHMLVVIL